MAVRKYHVINGTLEKRFKPRKFAGGVQMVGARPVPPKNNVWADIGEVGLSAGAGVAGGAVAGPAGMIAGGAAGLATGLAKVLGGNKAEQEQYDADLALWKGQKQDVLQGNILDSNQLTTQFNQIAKAGVYATGTEEIEVEKNELIFTKTATGKYVLKADFKDGKTHNKGGEDYQAADGDIIFPGKDRTKVMKAYKAQDFPKLESMRMALPKDTDKAQFGLDNTDPKKTKDPNVWDPGWAQQQGFGLGSGELLSPENRTRSAAQQAEWEKNKKSAAARKADPAFIAEKRQQIKAIMKDLSNPSPGKRTSIKMIAPIVNEVGLSVNEIMNGNKTFSSDGKGYNYEQAIALGVSPDGSGKWPAFTKDGILLAGSKNPTYKTEIDKLGKENTASITIGGQNIIYDSNNPTSRVRIKNLEDEYKQKTEAADKEKRFAGIQQDFADLTNSFAQPRETQAIPGRTFGETQGALGQRPDTRSEQEQAYQAAYDKKAAFKQQNPRAGFLDSLFSGLDEGLPAFMQKSKAEKAGMTNIEYYKRTNADHYGGRTGFEGKPFEDQPQYDVNPDGSTTLITPEAQPPVVPGKGKSKGTGKGGYIDLRNATANKKAAALKGQGTGIQQVGTLGAPAGIDVARANQISKSKVDLPGMQGTPGGQGGGGFAAGLGYAAQGLAALTNLFPGEAEVEKSPELRLDKLKYTDTSALLRQQSKVNERVQASNARNVSGGNIQNYLANRKQLGISNLRNQQAINTQEYQRALGISNQNIQIANRESIYNNQLLQRDQEVNAANRSARQNIIRVGVGQLGELGGQIGQDTMARKNQELLAQAIGSGQYSAYGKFKG